MGRPPLYDDALRERLIDVTAKRAFDEGFEAVSLRGVASDAQTTTAAVYALFGDKAGLHRAVFERAVDVFAATLGAVVPTADTLESIIQLGLAYRRAALADPHGYQIMFGGIAYPEAAPESAAARLSDTFEPLLALVSRAIDEGLLDGAAGAPGVATALWANVHGLSSIEVQGALPVSGTLADDLAELSIRKHVAGWATS